MTERIAAIVISYNRLGELTACVNALRKQTRPLDEIVVIDSGSTDGSREWLAAQSDVHTILQANLGAAGAIRSGQAYALAQNFDWVWCMDDDVLPAPQALQALCAAILARPDARVFNSLGMSRTHPDRFAVGALWVRTNPDDYLNGYRAATLAAVAPYADANGIVDSIGGHFYHGVLLHRTVIETVGSPLPWLYMCGEEIEYGYRIMRSGYHIYSVLGSIVYHPEIPAVLFRFLGKTKDFKIRPPERRYYFIRNGVWIHRTYFQTPLLAFVARRLGGAFMAELFVIPNRSLRERVGYCLAAVRGVRDGLALQPARDAQGKPILT